MKITDSVYFYRGREEEKLIRGAGSCNVIVVKSDRQVMVDTGLIVGGASAKGNHVAYALGW